MDVLSSITTAVVSVTISSIIAYSLDRRKEKRNRKEKSISVYEEIVDIFTSEEPKNNISLNEVEQILKRNEHLFDSEFRKLLPSSLEFDAFWCHTFQNVYPHVATSILLSCEDREAKHTTQLTIISVQTEFKNPETYFWFEEDNKKDRWVKVAELALVRYNSLAGTSRTLKAWKLASFASVSRGIGLNSSG